MYKHRYLSLVMLFSIPLYIMGSQPLVINQPRIAELTPSIEHAIEQHDASKVLDLIAQLPAVTQAQKDDFVQRAEKELSKVHGRLSWVQHLPNEALRIAIGSVLVGLATWTGKPLFKFAKVMRENKKTSAISATLALASMTGLGATGGYYIITGLQGHHTRQMRHNAETIAKLIRTVRVEPTSKV